MFTHLNPLTPASSDQLALSGKSSSVPAFADLVGSPASLTAPRGLPASRTWFMEPRCMAERLIHMRVSGVLITALAVSFLAGCGDQGPATTRAQSGVAGRVLVGPQCPVETEGDPCANEPAAGSRVTVAKQLPGDTYAGGEVVARTTTDADGSYRVAVAPGEYVVTADAGMSCGLMDARVNAGAHSKVDIPCDTGIR